MEVGIIVLSCSKIKLKSTCTLLVEGVENILLSKAVKSCQKRSAKSVLLKDSPSHSGPRTGTGHNPSTTEGNDAGTAGALLGEGRQEGPEELQDDAVVRGAGVCGGHAAECGLVA